ncbi:transducin/WD40 repeat-like superfamily protein [Tanacetum coccineum]
MSEKELRERLIGCSFLATINGCNANWQAVGLAQMRRWVANNNCKDYVKLLASEVKKIEKRCVAEEECSYCSAPVVFLDTEEVAYYQDDRCSKDGVTQKHKLERYPLTVDSKERVTIMHNGSSNGEILSKPFCPFCGVLLQRMQPEFLLSTSLQRSLLMKQASVLMKTMLVWNEFLTTGTHNQLQNNLWTVAIIMASSSRFLKRGVNAEGRVANDVEQSR